MRSAVINTKRHVRVRESNFINISKILLGILEVWWEMSQGYFISYMFIKGGKTLERYKEVDLGKMQLEIQNFT